MPSSPGVFPDLKALIVSRSSSVIKPFHYFFCTAVHFTLLIKKSLQLTSVSGDGGD
jgi:hypothetical protein